MGKRHNGHTGRVTASIGKAYASALDMCHSRLAAVIVVFVLAFSVIAFRLFDIGVLSGWVTVSDRMQLEKPLEYARKEIVDRNGVLLATNLNAASLYANPKKIINIKEAVKKLTKLLPGLDKTSLRKQLAMDRHFVWIKRGLTPKLQYEINALGIPGLYFQDEVRRVYPHGKLFSHFLGYVDVDGNGLAGVEKSYEKELKYPITGDGAVAPLELSLDVRVQTVVHTFLGQAMQRFRAKGATGIVMNVNSGEVLSLVSLPDFDPHKPNEAVPEHLFNRATLGVYEMGSTFKTFTMAMALDTKTIRMGDRFDVSTPLRVARFLIKDYRPKKGRLRVPEIFMYSSNIGTAKIAQELGTEIQREYLQALGLMAPLPVQLPERGTPLYPKRWGEVGMMTVSYGHGIAVTPLHIVNATIPLVNGGKRIAPRLVPGGAVADEFDQVVSQYTSDKVRKLLRYAVAYGTGKSADAEGYLVGGKTGSADKAKSGKYGDAGTVASFVSVFPMNKPEYIVFTMLDEPKGEPSTGGFTTGGVVAAPVAKAIIRNIAPILGVQPVDSSALTVRREFFYDSEQQKNKTYTF